MFSPSLPIPASLSLRDLVARLEPHGLNVSHRTDGEGVSIRGCNGTFLITNADESLQLRELSHRVEVARRRLHRANSQPGNSSAREECQNAISSLREERSRLFKSLREVFPQRLRQAIRMTDLLKDDFFSSGSGREPACPAGAEPDPAEWKLMSMPAPSEAASGASCSGCSSPAEEQWEHVPLEAPSAEGAPVPPEALRDGKTCSVQ
jgi:hypothetical protein